MLLFKFFFLNIGAQASIFSRIPSQFYLSHIFIENSMPWFIVYQKMLWDHLKEFYFWRVHRSFYGINMLLLCFLRGFPKRYSVIYPLSFGWNNIGRLCISPLRWKNISFMLFMQMLYSSWKDGTNGISAINWTYLWDNYNFFMIWI